MLVALLTLAAWWGVSQSHVAEPERSPLQVHTNLIGVWIDGEYVRTTARLAPGSPRGQRHTTEADPRERARAIGTVTVIGGERTETWLVGRKPTFSLDVVHPVERQLVLRLANAAGEVQQVSLFFNGRLLTRAELPALEKLVSVSATVPAALQRVGRNAVELVFEATAPRELAGRTLPLPLAARWDLAEFGRPGGDSAEESVPPTPTTILEDGTRIVRLGPASMVRTGLELPVSDRVILRYTLRRADFDYDLGVTSDEGGRVELRSPGRVGGAPMGPVEIEHDLTPWAGRTVILDVRSGEAAGGELHIGPAAILWEPPVGDPGAPTPGPSPLPALTADPNTLVPRPSVLLVTFDSLERSHVSGLGHARWTTPNLDRLMEQGVVFSDASSPASTTPAALTALHTGHDPFAAAGDAPGLAARFAEAGWRTAAFVAHPEAGAAEGFDGGFELFVERHGADGRGAPGAELLGPLQEFLEGVGDEPFFAWVHLDEPNAPYAAPPELQRALVRPYEGTVRGDLEWLTTLGERDEHVGWEGWTHLRDLYDARVTEGDAILGQVLQSLQWTGQDARTLVAITSAHGEALGDHGGVLHGTSVYGDQLNVPLVLLGPGLRPWRRDDPATLTDLGPTLLARAGLPVPAGLDGVDLLGGVADPARPLPARSGGDQAMLSWRRGPLQLVLDAGTRRRALYDVRADPRQRADMSADLPATVSRFERELLDAWCRGGEPAEDGPDCQVLRGSLRRL